MEEKNLLDFKREFELINPLTLRRLPYFDVINQNEKLRNDLLREFLLTDLKPNIYLYLDSVGYTEEYMQAALARQHASKSFRKEGKDKIPYQCSENLESNYNEACRNFSELNLANKLSPYLYSHDIEATPLVKTLRVLGDMFDRFKSSVKEKEFIHYDNDAKVFAFSVVSELNKINSSLFKNQMLSTLLNDNDNFGIGCIRILGNSVEKEEAEKALNRYAKLKQYFNFYIERAVFDQDKEVPRIVDGEERLKRNLEDAGFFELENVKSLGEQSQSKLIELINSRSAGYKIAMLSYLGFMDKIQVKLVDNRKVHKSLSHALELDERTIRGQVNALRKESDDREKYKSFKYLEEVEKEYNNLK